MGVSQDGQEGSDELTEVEAGESTIRIYYVKNESIFNKREKSLCKQSSCIIF